MGASGMDSRCCLEKLEVLVFSLAESNVSLPPPISTQPYALVSDKLYLHIPFSHVISRNGVISWKPTASIDKGGSPWIPHQERQKSTENDTGLVLSLGFKKRDTASEVANLVSLFGIRQEGNNVNNATPGKVEQSELSETSLGQSLLWRGARADLDIGRRKVKAAPAAAPPSSAKRLRRVHVHLPRAATEAVFGSPKGEVSRRGLSRLTRNSSGFPVSFKHHRYFSGNSGRIHAPAHTSDYVMIGPRAHRTVTHSIELSLSIDQ
nr:plastid division protein PDV2-like [Ipomoea batatas]